MLSKNASGNFDRHHVVCNVIFCGQRCICMLRRETPLTFKVLSVQTFVSHFARSIRMRMPCWPEANNYHFLAKSTPGTRCHDDCVWGQGRDGACGTRLISPVSQLPEQQRSFVVSAASCFCFVLAEEVLRERRLFAKREEYHRYHSCHHSCSWRMWTPCRQVAVPIPTPIKCLTRLRVVWRVDCLLICVNYRLITLRAC